MTEFDEPYRKILHAGLNRLRDAAVLGNLARCQAEAEYLHNIPSLMGEEANNHRHLDHATREREAYLKWVQAANDPDLEWWVACYYAPSWREIDEILQKSIYLDELLWDCGDGRISFEQWQQIIDHTFQQFCAFIGGPLRIDGEPSITNQGFGLRFESDALYRSPLNIRIWGTYGASVVDGEHGNYVLVQGFVFFYMSDKRIVLSPKQNHIYIRYVRADAHDGDWEMKGCTGLGQWRSYGWSDDEFAEFGGYETWPGATAGESL